VKAALLALWSAALPTVQVTYGNRVTMSGPKRLTIGNARGASAPQSLGPARQMREDYRITCLISCSVNGTIDDQSAVTEDVLSLFEAAELAVRSSANQTLGVSEVTLAIVEGDWELTEAPASDTGGPINTTYEFEVRVQARYRLP
jgi:hypothetical protein